MTNIQPKETAQEAKPDLFAGIDVGAEELILVIRKNGKPCMIKINKILLKDQVSFNRLLGGRPTLRTGC